MFCFITDDDFKQNYTIIVLIEMKQKTEMKNINCVVKLNLNCIIHCETV